MFVNLLKSWNLETVKFKNEDYLMQHFADGEWKFLETFSKSFGKMYIRGRSVTGKYCFCNTFS